MKIEITQAQLQSLSDVAQDMEAMLGSGGDIDNKEHGNPDKVWRRHIRNINNLFIKNGYKKPCPNIN